MEIIKSIVFEYIRETLGKHMKLSLFILVFGTHFKNTIKPKQKSDLISKWCTNKLSILCIQHANFIITFFIMVSFFHVSTPFKNAFVDVPTNYHNESRALLESQIYIEELKFS